MGPYNLGDLATISTEVKNAAGVLSDPTAIVLSLLKPNNATITPTVLHDATGKYHSDFTVDLAGAWIYQWVTTGAVVGASETGVFTVLALLSGPVYANNGLWTYSGDPLFSGRDRVRDLVGDTDSTDPLINNVEIDIEAAQTTNLFWAAAAVADKIAARFAREVTYSVDSVQVGTDELQDKYRQLATDLRERARRESIAMPYAGAISISDIDTVNNDGDRAGTFFEMGMNDNFRSGSSGPVSADQNNPLKSPPPSQGG